MLHTSGTLLVLIDLGSGKTTTLDLGFCKTTPAVRLELTEWMAATVDHIMVLMQRQQTAATSTEWEVGG